MLSRGDLVSNSGLQSVDLIAEGRDQILSEFLETEEQKVEKSITG